MLLPVLETSNCIYEFTCMCESIYIGRTDRCLSIRVKEHLSKWLLNSVNKTLKSPITSQLLDSKHSVDFSKVINKQSILQSIKYAGACVTRIYRPTYCIRKELVVNFGIPW